MKPLLSLLMFGAVSCSFYLKKSMFIDENPKKAFFKLTLQGCWLCDMEPLLPPPPTGDGGYESQIPGAHSKQATQKPAISALQACVHLQLKLFACASVFRQSSWRCSKDTC